ncbi:GntR family transcriptional regulator [Mameliella sediminis]|uniref:GntR family transcriptional regulator n=1 Tax=Mameliella sediminis TaxID=2836866 RepID=UPI001C44AFDC|nr:GntR family transcriptional regulator [Mameliella sediminis]MBV7395716.1 GntR family transcriptional regulator [Mameliella sediminis]MBY6115333.1 GntR family transcriptional regulator [Antarctobacter heliothermus]MBY6144602.1 GntR family transcriptional regulator [Mameliella alba]MCA0956142.1 GntR family transcriptional regulator [Mameliella alba]
MTSEDDSAPQGNAAYHRLLDELRAGRLGPGDRLRETDLAERLGMSRTPVREAIRQLEADGIVSHVPRQGASIRTLEYAEVMDLYEMRAVLEGTAARLAARAASDIEIEELIDMNRALETQRGTPEAFPLNRQFHAALLDAAKNRFLTRSMTSLQRAMMILGPTTLTNPERAELAVKEHFAVLDAVQARDGARAEAAMRAHIEAAQRVRVRTLRARPLYDGDLM